MTTDTRCLTAFDVETFSSDNRAAAMAFADPFGTGSLMLPVRSSPCEVGKVTFASGKGWGAEPRGDLLVLASTLSLSDGATAATVHAGESVGIALGISVIDNKAPLAPSNPPATELLLGQYRCAARARCSSPPTSPSKCGMWDSAPYQCVPIHCTHTELMDLLEGRVTVVDGLGPSRNYSAGGAIPLECGADASSTKCASPRHSPIWRIPG